mmetsp:Transcript_35828/g.60662  ORF Transcript_35828/g.60662 Transcript_35828/m.60662 type:complete len:476 (-) Transcript_35828:314-1741(-)
MTRMMMDNSRQTMFSAVVVSLIFWSSAAQTLHLDEAISNIRADLLQQEAEVLEATTTCDLATSSCPLSEMSTTESTQVFTGGNTRCIYEDSTPYSFQVLRGDPSKMLFYFQGGGACWNEASTKLGLCSTDAKPASLSGMFNRDPSVNPDFYDWTLVHVLYCSGDVHVGNSTRDYTDSNGGSVVQVGALNAIAVLDWVTQQGLGELDQLLIAGCSAGSVGAQVQADWVLSHLPAKSAAVVPDSFTGLFPPGSQGPLIKDFGLCDSVLLDAWPDLQTKCAADELTLQDIVMNTLKAHPTVPIAHVNSKTDAVQQAYYVAIGALNRSLDAFITPKLYYEGINAIYEGYHELPNHVAFLVSSSMHCYTNNGFYFTADNNSLLGAPQTATSLPSPGGSRSSEDGDESKTMKNWVNALPLAPSPPSSSSSSRAARDGNGGGGGNISWACAGERLPQADALDQAPHAYCDSDLTDRVVVAAS